MAVANRDISFLWFKETKEEAWSQEVSPVVENTFRGQLHLLPFDPQPYLQITDSPVSLQINNDANVFLLDCNDEKVNINNHVDLRSITDENGIKQIYIRLKYLPLDYGANLVCLKIESTIGLASYNYYSNPFLLTSLDYEKTSRVDYRVNRNYTENEVVPDAISYPNLYQSARLSFYFNNYIEATEIESYYLITRSQDVVSNVNENEHSEWVFEWADGWHWKRLAKALFRTPCYLNLERNYPVDGMELTPREGNSNVSESTFVTAPNPSDKINIIPIIIDPSITFVPFLASSSALSSASYLVSQSEIPEP